MTLKALFGHTVHETVSKSNMKQTGDVYCQVSFQPVSTKTRKNTINHLKRHRVIKQSENTKVSETSN